MYNTHPKLCYKILGKKSAYYTRDFTVLTFTTSRLAYVLKSTLFTMNHYIFHRANNDDDDDNDEI